MKKFLALILALVMCFSLVACGGDKKDDEASNSPSTSPSASPAPSGAGSQVQVEKDETKTYREEIILGLACDGFPGDLLQDTRSQHARRTN